MTEVLNEATFLFYAARHYDNPHCLDTDEFLDDLKRFSYIKRLFTKYQRTGVLKERMILNHLIVLYNTFGSHATNMLFFKLDTDYYPYLKPFLLTMGYLPEFIEQDGTVISANSISMDLKILETLKDL